MHTPSRRNIMCLSLLAAVSPLATSAFAAWAAPLAIKGYDPVAYFTFGKPTRGLAEFEYEWDEHRYRFARAEHLELFKADPVHYAPQFAGFCAVALARGEIDEGNPEYCWSARASSICSASRSDQPCSNRILPETSSRPNRTGRAL